MIKSNIKYLAFDDRLLFYLGVPIISFLLPLLFWGISFNDFINYGLVNYLEGLLYSLVYWIFNRTLIIALRKRFHIFSQTRKRLTLQIIIALIVLPMLGAIISLMVYYFYSISIFEDVYEPSFFQALAATYFLTFTVALLYETIYFIHKYREVIMEKNQIELAHIQGQLDNLRNQINPHFLFNSLNTLMNLIPTDTNRAMDYLSKLSKFYRYTVSSQNEPLTVLETEIGNAKIYADLLHERFYKAITIHFPKSPFPSLKIPPLSLQLLIENAVKHNIVAQSKPLNIEILINAETKYIYVKNNIQLKIEEVSSTGMGLKNIQKRIAYFTDRPVLIEDSGTQFSVAIPLILKEKKA